MSIKKWSNYDITSTFSRNNTIIRDQNGQRSCHGNDIRFQNHPNYRDLLLFHQYFNDDNGKGLGASHQTGWTALIIHHIQDTPKLRDTDKL